jgi:hypothetical protein
MRGLLYFIWFLIPTLMMLFALWLKLESFSKRTSKEFAKDMFLQSVFVFGCAAVSVLIDTYLLPPIYESFLSLFVPYGMCEFMILPLVLFLGAVCIGESAVIRITKAPRPTEKKK